MFLLLTWTKYWSEAAKNWWFLMRSCHPEGALESRCSENSKNVSFFKMGKAFGQWCSYEKFFLKFQKCSSKTSTLQGNPFQKALQQRCFPRILANFFEKVFIGTTLVCCLRIQANSIRIQEPCCLKDKSLYENT